MTPAIRTRGLTRSFPGGHGVRDLDIEVPAGSIYGFLGPNGAGKTTTIRLLLGLLRRDGGSVELFGQPLTRTALGGIGALVEMPSLYGHLSGRGNLEITRRLLDAPRARVDETLERVDLRDAADRRVREYSLGMRQRLAIALALLGRPKLLILDEPGNGLDPAGILDMRRLLRTLRDEDGLTVFVYSHLLAEVEQVASHVGVLHDGRMRFEGTLATLRERAGPRLTLRCDAPERAGRLLAEHGEHVLDRDGDTLSLSPQRRGDAEINRLLVQHGIGVSHLARERPSLESLFFALTEDGGRADCAAEAALERVA
jgi:ABC-2 type transport system ATP-binding protein